MLVLALIVLVGFFSALAFLPRHLSNRLLSLHEKSRFWVRLIGICGLLWVALAVTANLKFKILNSSTATKARLYAARHYLGGAIVALFVALYTQRFERGASNQDSNSGEKRQDSKQDE